MKSISEQIVFQEVPDEVSLSFLISWCPLKCEWCYSKEWYDVDWEELTVELLREKLNKYWELITCVLFLWWEWQEKKLLELLDEVKSFWLKTCLYTWRLFVKEEMMTRLDYIKTWPWISSLWWLNSKTTNQKFINVVTWENMNYRFTKS